MKVDFSQTLRSIDGLPMRDRFGNKPVLSFVCSRSLMRGCDLFPEFAQKKMDVFRLAKKIGVGGVVELSVEELSILKFCVHRVCVAEVSVPAIDALGGI